MLDEIDKLQQQIGALKFAMAILVLIQIGLLSLGVYQVMSDNPITIAVGVFNIVANLVFGAMNIRAILK